MLGLLTPLTTSALDPGGSNKKALMRKNRLTSREGGGGQPTREWKTQIQASSLPPAWVGLREGEETGYTPQESKCWREEPTAGLWSQGSFSFLLSLCCGCLPLAESCWKPEARTPEKLHSDQCRAEKSTNGELRAHCQAPTGFSLASEPLHLPGPCWAHPSVLST